MENSKTMTTFSSGYRFVEGTRVTAILDKDGKLSLKDLAGGLEVYTSWREYVKNVMGDTPTNGGEDAAIEQLALTLGGYEPMGDHIPTGNGHSSSAKKDKEKDDMTTATAGAAAAKKAAPAKKVAAKVAPVKAAKKAPTAAADLPYCVCGCNEKVGKVDSKFRPGHDARVHGWFKKVERGDMKLGDMSPAAQSLFKAEGHRVGSAKPQA